MKKNYFLFVICFIFMVISCKNTITPTPEQIVVDSPNFYPPAGEFSHSTLKVSLSTKTDDAYIYYTIDGSEPNEKSNKYSGEFSILDSKVVKAIAIRNGIKSDISTADYKLNVGKNSNQMGSIHGRVILSENLPDDIKAQLKNETIFIFSKELPGVIKQTKLGEEYIFDGLDTSKKYSFFFTNKEPNNIIESRSITRGLKNSPIVATYIENQQPSEGYGLDLDAVLKITGKIQGTAVRYNSNGQLETDNAGTIVFIPGTSYSAITDSKGNFEITNVPQGCYTIRAQYPTYISQEVNSILLQSDSLFALEPPVVKVDKTFELNYGQGNIKGTAILEGASASENSGINVVLTDIEDNHSYSALTTLTGSWGITDVYPGTYSIEYSKDGYSPIVTGNIKVSAASTTQVNKIVLNIGGCSISGKVNLLDSDDNTGIQILLKKVPTKDNLKEMSYFGITDKDGIFSIFDIMPGDYIITASYPGYMSVSQENIRLVKGDVFKGLTLPTMGKKTTSISGKVILEGLSSFEGSTVSLTNIDTNTLTASSITGIDGTYIFTKVNPGNYIISVSHPGYLSNNNSIVSLTNNSNFVVDVISLNTALGKIQGKVKLEDNTDNSGVSILLSSDNNNKTFTTITEADGSYSFVGIEPGIWKIQVTKGGYITKKSDSFSVSAGEITRPNELLLKISMRSLYGNITLEGKSDYTGIKITATNINNPTEIYSALTNKDGFFALSSLKPGEYTISYSFDNFVTYTSSSVNILKETNIKMDTVELKKATGSITGIVNLEGCTDHSNITVQLVGTDKEFITNSDGVYTFIVPSGNYPGGVRFTKEDFTTTAKAETITVLTDNTFAVTNTIMKATASTLKGKVDLVGNTDDSGIVVTIDGIDSAICSTTSDKDGNWTLKHVPLGKRTVRFTKINVPDVTTQVVVVPSNFNEIENIQMIPNSATLKGYVYLDGMSDNSNICITVTNDGKPNLLTKTLSDGSFEINNILASGIHTITFSKNGWDSQSITIDDFNPLEIRTIGTKREYLLKDTTSPILNSISINENTNFTNNPKLNVKIDAYELGSGIEKMTVQIKAPNYASIYPSQPNWQNYQISFTEDLSQLPKQIYTGNGEYILYIKVMDKAGNISEMVSDKITVTDQVSILRGVLKGYNLHLTKQNSPYRVESDIAVELGDTLVIDPGVQVEFAGHYMMKIVGEINAIGSPTERIVLKSSKDNHSWAGIRIDKTCQNVVVTNTYDYSDGNILKYCDVYNASSPINETYSQCGNCYLDNVNFDDSCGGPIAFNRSKIYIFNSKLNNGIWQFWCDSGYAKNNYIKNRVYLSDTTSNYSNNTFVDSEIYTDGLGVTLTNNVFDNSYFNFDQYDRNDRTGSVSKNNFINSPKILVDASMTNYTGLLKFNNNYWGNANTEELNLVGESNDISFINDYYDNYNNVKIDYSGWSTQPNENCGCTIK